MKKVIHSVKSIRNLFQPNLSESHPSKPKPSQSEPNQPDQTAENGSSIYPNYGYPAHDPAHPDTHSGRTAGRSVGSAGSVESSVGHENPLYFYNSPPAPPSWNRDDTRPQQGFDPARVNSAQLGANRDHANWDRADQNHANHQQGQSTQLPPSVQQESDAERYRKQQHFLEQIEYLEQMRRDRHRIEQQRYDQQREEHHFLERQRTQQVDQQQRARSADYYAKQYPQSAPQHRAADHHTPPYDTSAQYETGLYAVPQQMDRTVDIVAQPDTRPKQDIRYGEELTRDQTQTQPVAQSFTQQSAAQQPVSQPRGTAMDEWRESLQRSQTLVTSAASRFVAWMMAWFRGGTSSFLSLFNKEQSSFSLAVRSGIFVAVIMLIFGGWFQFARPSATADQAQNRADLDAPNNSGLAILSVENQPAAAQNSVADGLAILSAKPASNGNGDNNTGDNNGRDLSEPQVQTVAQALASAPTAVPTETPTPRPTFTPSATPTPTVIPTEEIPDEIPEVNIIGSFFDDLEFPEDKVAQEKVQVRRTATPTVTPTPLPLSPGRLWSTFIPGPPSETDHFWIGRPFFSSAKTQIASSNYQFGSTASSRYRVHYGVDISNPMGTEVRGATSGVVIHAGPDDPILLGPYTGFYGNAVVIRLDQRLPVAGGELDVFLLYGHLSTLNVSVGDAVKPDDIVGFVGMRGIALGPHLHVEVRLGANTYNHIVNPYVWMEPIAGTGAIAVRLLTADGRTWRSARVSLLRYENGRSVWSRYIETYSDDGYLGPDPAWGENGAMGSLKPGTYQVISILNGERVKAQVQVSAGETAFVELRSKQ